MKTVRLGTRGSPLALWQARAVATAIDLQGMASCEICIVKTSGDQLGKTKINTDGKRLFVKEIEEALINDEIDLAVHERLLVQLALVGALGAAPLRREPFRPVSSQTTPL